MTTENRNDLPAEGDDLFISKALTLVSGKWRLYLILLIGENTLRYSQLREQLPTISEKVLAGELKALVALEVLHRKVYAQVPPRVEYTLTPKSRLALPILRSLLEIGRIFT